MTKKWIQLTNEFHGTATRALLQDGLLNSRQVKRAWSKLCGVDGCLCGDDAGTRPGVVWHRYGGARQSEMVYYSVLGE